MCDVLFLIPPNRKVLASKCSEAKRKMTSVAPDERFLAREDSLEYFIKFPVAHSVVSNGYNGHLPAATTAAATDYTSFVNGDENVPIVLLLGWAGCQDRYLMKYSKIYEDRGLITVRYTAPVENIFWKRDAMKPIGQKIVKLLYDMNFDSHPLIIHLFSNGGAYLYQNIDLAVKELETPLDICGIIFDSAPGDRRLMGLYRAISHIYGRDRRCNCIVSWCITLGLAIRWVAEDAFKAIKGVLRWSAPIETNPYNSLKNLVNYTPQLFLYSDQDKLIPSKDIERFAKHRREANVCVDTVCFAGAEHVKLYAKYPEKYVQCVCNFINNCLANIQFAEMNGDKKLN